MDTAYAPAGGGMPPDLLKGLRAISEPSRARVVEYLGGGERCVCDLGTALNLSPALASHHLRALKSSGLIRERRSGKWVYYSLDVERLTELRTWIDRLLTPSGDSAARAVRLDCGPTPENPPLETR